MLGFFRKYQKFFFIAITAVIVLTFSVFGTYGSITEPRADDPIVLQTIDGRPILLSDLNKMTRFFATDATDKLQYGGVQGPNFLNDGLIRKEFLEGGLALPLVQNCHDMVEPELKLRRERERRYASYQHPQAPFLGSDSVWANFAPEVKHHLEAMKDNDGEFTDRVGLYLAEQEFPQRMLKQVLRFQESQYDWLPQDPNLERWDLALFGYHSLEDWFGGHFLTLTAELVMNGASLARERGYKVTPEEAWADLLRNAETSFQHNHGSPHVRAANSRSYLESQLRLMGITRKEAVNIWQQALLFRRIFHDVGSTALVDSFGFEKFLAYAEESVKAERTNLPVALHLKSADDLKAFEAYCNAVYSDKEAELPRKLRPLSEVDEAVLERGYKLSVKTVEKEALRRALPIKEVWNFELANWDEFAEAFPILAAVRAETRDERFEALDALDRPTRKKVDRFAQERMVSVDFSDVDAVDMDVSLSLKGGKPPLPGLNDRKALLEKLGAEETFTMTSDDGEHLYEIAVVERGEDLRLLSFSEAKERDVLKAMMRKVDIQPTVKRIYDACKKAGLPELPEKPTAEFAATHRFFPYLESVRNGEEPAGGQWALTTHSITIRRSEPGEIPFDAMKVGSAIPTENGYLTILEKQVDEDASLEAIDKAQHALSLEAKCMLMNELLKRTDDRQALTLAWLEEER